jgi:hypothetical protein
MDWQLALVGLIIAAATAYIGRRAWRTWGRKASGCGGGCGTGCKSTASKDISAPARLIPLEQITVRRRE